MNVFFYGLFMDRDILSKNGIHPTNPRKGHLNDYTLKIGARASLIPCKEEKAYGVVMEVGEDELTKLYAEESVADYVPEPVEITTESNEHVMATCYNLPLELLSGTNPEYARSLYKLAKKLGFPDTYLKRIEKMMNTSDHN